jgi:hypothetical protein
MQEAIEESGLLVGVDTIATVNLGTDLNPALEFSLDEEKISYEPLFSEETSFPYYEFLSLSLEL